VSEAVIVFCPCCVSAVDVDVPPEKLPNPVTELECVACGQEWSMVLDAERIAKYAVL
jgi:hypothetical protein